MIIAVLDSNTTIFVGSIPFLGRAAWQANPLHSSMMSVHVFFCTTDLFIDLISCNITLKLP